MESLHEFVLLGMLLILKITSIRHEKLSRLRPCRNSKPWTRRNRYVCHLVRVVSCMTYRVVLSGFDCLSQSWSQAIKGPFSCRCGEWRPSEIHSWSIWCGNQIRAWFTNQTKVSLAKLAAQSTIWHCRSSEFQLRVRVLDTTLAQINQASPDMAKLIRSEADARELYEKTRDRLEKYERTYGSSSSASSSLPADTRDLSALLRERDESLQKMRLKQQASESVRETLDSLRLKLTALLITLGNRGGV